jgi:osmotically-inducible protein OsmY
MKKMTTLILTVLFAASVVACASVSTEQAQIKPGATREGDDTLITSTIEQKLFRERTLRTSRIYVNTKNGVVRLTGFVEKSPYVETATTIARETPGVVAVKEQLLVKDPGE